MNPSVSDRLNSVLRALNGVILPALPAEASLAKEQTQLILGHISIIVAQLDAQPDFEKQEAEDFAAMAQTIIAQADGGSLTKAAATSLENQLANADLQQSSLQRTATTQNLIDSLLLALNQDGDPAAKSLVEATIFDLGSVRARKDREWFKHMGFDSELASN